MTATWNPTAEEREKIRRLEEYQRRERARIDAMLKALAEERERERREREAERDARLKKEMRLYSDVAGQDRFIGDCARMDTIVELSLMQSQIRATLLQAA